MADYVKVGKVSDFKEGSMETFEIDGEDVAVVFWNGRFFAFGNACTHRGVPLSAGWCTDDNEVVCLLHAAVYDMETGKCLRGPTRGQSVPSYTVRIEGDDVYVGDRVQVETDASKLGSWWLKLESDAPRTS